MSCSGGKCGSGCGGSKMNPDFSGETTTTETLIVGVAPQEGFSDGAEMTVVAENGCKCGSNCTCDPCNCK